MTDQLDAITEAQAPDNFDVLSFIEGTAYPTERVTVYTAAKAATDLLALNNQRLINDKNGVVDDKLDVQINDLTETVKKSALTFELRGMPPGLVRDIYNVSDEDSAEQQADAEHRLVANTITGVKNAANQSDSRVWDAEAVKALSRFLKEAEYAKLVKGVIDVNFNASVFDQATDAGFLGGSTDVGA